MSFLKKPIIVLNFKNNQIRRFGARAGKVQNLLIRANGKDTTIFDSNRFGIEHVRIHREDVATLVYLVCVAHFNILYHFVA